MNNQESTVYTIIKLTTDFLSDNAGYLLTAFLFLLFRHPISDLILKLKSLSFSRGASKLDLAITEEKAKRGEPEEDGLATPEDENEIKKDQTIEEGSNLLSDALTALYEGNEDLADKLFYDAKENDENPEVAEQKEAYYLYLKHSILKSTKPIEKLERMTRLSSTESSRVIASKWYTIYLTDTNQKEKAVALWRRLKEEAKSEKEKAEASIQMAHALINYDSPEKAKNELMSVIEIAPENDQLSDAFEALSEAEEALGNIRLSTLCKDKALQFKPDDREALFSTAYYASKNNFHELSIANYETLINLDRSNHTAQNNLGVQARNKDLKIIAVEKYKQAALDGSSLAMANQGYLMLDAGFIDEAEVLAREALAQNEPHPNAHALISDIENRKQNEFDSWKKILNQTERRQKILRSYTEQYYTGKKSKLEGKWLLNDSKTINLEINKSTLRVEWQELEAGLSQEVIEASLEGEVTGSTFWGTYKRRRGNEPKTGLIGALRSKSTTCFGLLNEDGTQFAIYNTEPDEKVNIKLIRPHHIRNQ